MISCCSLFSYHNFLALYRQRYFFHCIGPICLQWVDIHRLGMAFLDECRGVAVGKFSLYETVSDFFLPGSFDETLELGGAWLPAFFLDGKLLQLVITGEVGEDRVIDDELANHLRIILETLSDDAILPVDVAEQLLIVFLEESLVFRFQLAECLEDVAGDDAGVFAPS